MERGCRQTREMEEGGTCCDFISSAKTQTRWRAGARKRKRQAGRRALSREEEGKAFENPVNTFLFGFKKKVGAAGKLQCIFLL